MIRKDTDAHDAHGAPLLGSAHAVTVRTPDERLVWLASLIPEPNISPTVVAVNNPEGLEKIIRFN